MQTVVAMMMGLVWILLAIWSIAGPADERAERGTTSIRAAFVGLSLVIALLCSHYC